LVGLLAIPSPREHIITRLVGDIHLIHDAEFVAASDQVALSKLIEMGLKHCSTRACRRGRTMDCVWRGVDAAAALGALQEILAATSLADIAIASWNRIPTPLIPCFADVGGSRDLDVSMGAVFKVHGGVLAGEREDIALKAFLVECGSLWAEAVRIPATVLGTQSPAHLCSTTSLPISGSPLRQDLRTFRVRSVALRCGGIRSWIGVTTRNATRVHDRGLAWGAPRVVLREIPASGLAMRIPRTRLRVIVDWFHQTFSFCAMRTRIQRFASHGAS
jgi:hypothetical protein